MLITLLRHATAEPHSPADAERALVKKGKNQVQRVAAFCRQHGLLPGVLYSSPLRRAQQTATLLQVGLPDCPAVIDIEWLSPGIHPRTVVNELRELEEAGIGDVWLVGHEPNLSVLTGHLLTTDGAAFLIKKASLTRVEVDFAAGLPGQLLWSVPCALMR